MEVKFWITVAITLCQIDYSYTAFPSTITIGGIFDREKYINVNTTASERAFNLAINDINSNASVLPGITLKGVVNTIESLDFQKSSESLCDQIGAHQIVALIGPSRSTPVKTTNYICSGIGLPHITYGATNPSIHASYQQYPYLLRTNVPGYYLCQAIIDLVKYFEWPRISILTSTDDYGSSLEDILHMAIKKEITVAETAVFTALSNISLIDFTTPLMTIRNSLARVLIVHCAGKYAQRLLQVASNLNMIGSGWIWIVTDSIATEPYMNDVGVTLPTYYRGLLAIMPSTTRTRNKINFENKWELNNGKLPLSPYSYKIYDAVWIVALALNEMLKDSKNLALPTVSCVQCDQPSLSQWPDGEVLLKYMKQVNFYGELEPISFKSDGTMVNGGLEYINYQKNKFVTVGHWYNSSGVTIDENSITWPQNSDFNSVLPLLHNITFRVVTLESLPFMRKKTGNYVGNDRWEGYCKDMLDIMSRELGFNYILHECNDLKFGAKNPDTQEWNGLVNELATGLADMAVTAFTISSIRQEVIDFTVPYLDLGLTALIKKEQPQKSFLAFMDPFTNDVWFMLFCSTMYVGLLLSVCSTFSPYGYYGQQAQVDRDELTEEEIDDFDEEKNNMRLDEAAWFSMGSLLGQGTDFQPKAISGKVVAAMWWMTGTIFVATYTANLAAFLTVTKSSITIQTLEDLAKQDKVKYGTVLDTQPMQFFQTSAIPIYQKIWAKMVENDAIVDSENAALAKVQEGDYAMIWDSAILEYVVNQSPCNTYMLTDLFSPHGYGIGLPQNFPYKNILSSEILRLREGGFLDKIKNEWFVQKGVCGVKKKSTVVTVQLEDVLGVYTLVIGGIVLAFVFLIAEWIYFTWKVANKKDSRFPSFKEALKARFKLVWKDMKSRWISRRPRAKTSSEDSDRL